MKFKFNISWESFLLLNVIWICVLFFVFKSVELNNLTGSLLFAAIALTVIVDIKAFVAWRERRKNE
jgi:hypothetical protein